jgi:hypothetical protein
VTVILVSFLENNLLDSATYFALDVLSLSNEHVAAASVELDAAMTRKQRRPTAPAWSH